VSRGSKLFPLKEKQARLTMARMALEWPELGKRHAAQSAAFAPSKKQRTEQRLSCDKFDALFEKVGLPEPVEQLIRSFAVSNIHAAFREKYGPQNAAFFGQGFMPWGGRFNTHERWMWNVFTTGRWHGFQFRHTREVKCVTQDLIHPLAGKEVCIFLKDAHGIVTKIDPILVVFSERDRFYVEKGEYTFALMNSDVIRIDLFVDVATNRRTEWEEVTERICNQEREAAMWRALRW
jgi:hypothetical protein